MQGGIGENMIYQPYTYLIRFIITGQLYYGSKTAIDCHPDDFWVKYFTTSEIVKALITEHGKDSFEVLYTKNHATKEAALKWEELYLISVDAARNPNYLNRQNGGKNFVCNGHTEETKALMCITRAGENNPNFGREFSEEHKQKLRDAFSGENNPNWGKFGEDCLHYGFRHSEESKLKMSESRTGTRMGEDNPMWGKIVSEETRRKISEAISGENNGMFNKTHTNEAKQKISEANSGKTRTREYCEELSERQKKKYIITFPDGHEEVIIGLVGFCKLYNLDNSPMTKVAKSKQSNHKNYKCRYW